MHYKDWDPDLYLKFGKERLQPSVDLVARIRIEQPQSIIDIGCGPGNSTQILRQRWPGSKITGLDHSVAMIEKAEQDYPNQEWIQADAGKDPIPGQYDIVFSNAAIQWIPHHADLLAKLKGLLNSGGALAVQLPLIFDMPVEYAIEEALERTGLREIRQAVKALLTVHSATEYYDILAGLFDPVEIWQTDYMHVMENPVAVLKMIRSTRLKPYLERMPDAANRSLFEQNVLEGIQKIYPVQQNGKLLFPFKRLFFIGYNY
ncbi:hypothetical protein A8C56_03625 [Niabella ginsenosidivorans]|uniref:Methyltransferase domain-containing protein n=1 Tax=Niabella ginsenosidivorans TaxID=1176587 RepID=A0A1A9IAU3_9BACT|nr:methyltransferase domain-containing protein [Niabella ginsenosidivorans]ANH83684.1 hypothetical protein A8C56_03625 [Niabella ginsenosidivorans]